MWRQQEVSKDPMNKLILGVAKQHFTEDLASFNEDMRSGKHDDADGVRMAYLAKDLTEHDGRMDNAHPAL